MNRLFPFLIAFLLIFIFPDLSVQAEDIYAELPKCVVVSHCARETWMVSEVGESFKKIIKVVESMPRTKIIEQSDSYIHAEVQTKWMRYTDDLLIKAIPEKRIIQVRSESRVGIGDNGVNKKRIEDLSYKLTTNQIY
tara:strand:+ start:747 stop:1157 length:411 start_codon:yes stop_codon:yes gene_type:complete